MRICVAQTRPVKGNIHLNIENHRKFIELAIANQVDTLIFPELSLTGYEPALASRLAINDDDSRLQVFQKYSDDHDITIGVGAPMNYVGGITIGMLLFQPHLSREVYTKQHLHPDEDPFFVATRRFDGLIGSQRNTALAICYELSVPAHSRAAFHRGSEVYIASVVKTIAGVDKALISLADIARTYTMTVLMANSVGSSDGEESGGKSSVWDNTGRLLGQLNGTDEGIIMVHMESRETFQKTI